MKTTAIVSATASVILLSASLVSAHVTVKPNQVGVAAFQTYDMSVPVEKDMATTSLRLVIPDGLGEVTPSVKPGWTIDTKTTGTGDDEKTTEITWSGGQIPSGRRDDFTFSAQAPATVTTLQWKAYQTYADGSVVSWDQDPSTIKAGEEGTPYSKTAVVNDLATPAPSLSDDLQKATPMWLGGLSLIISILALGAASMKKSRR